MKKNYLIPEVELFEVQQTAALLAESIEIKEGELDEYGNPIGGRVNDFVFEW